MPVADVYHELINATSEYEVAQIASREAIARSAATNAYLFRRTGPALRNAAHDTAVSLSCLDACTDQQPWLLTTATDDPCLAPGTREVAALALPASDALLVVTRGRGQPFTSDTRTHMATLARPIVDALANVDRLRSMEHMALIDGLTSLGNRRRMDRDLQQTLRTAEVSNQPVAFAMIDVDNFKTYNDTHGHIAGDKVLQMVADTIKANVRSTDVVYRYGGEEFSVLLPGASPEAAYKVALRVRDAIEHTEFPGEATQPNGSLTVSVGVSGLNGEETKDVQHAADKALYEAKKLGRNQVVLTSAEPGWG